MIQGFCDRFLRWAYHANVMNTFDAASKHTVFHNGDIRNSLHGFKD
jgi:hypothetical protein